MSFQDELKRNMRSHDTVMNESAQTEANWIMSNIKDELIRSARGAKYTTQNGTTTISCFYRLPPRYLQFNYKSNGNEIARNQKRFPLFREPKIVYRTWWEYNIKPEYSIEYARITEALKPLAAKENIHVECGLHTPRDGKMHSLPAKVPSPYEHGAYLCVHAWTHV